VPTDSAAAFAPGRVNLIGEHTDYNHGLALAFAIAAGVTVRAHASAAAPSAPRRIRAEANDLGESDEFALGQPPATAGGWRAYVRGVVAELAAAGVELPATTLTIDGDVPRGAGLSSSAAFEVALCLALGALGRRTGGGWLERVEIARLCARVENDWVGAHTGLLDQLASLYGAPDAAVCIDFETLAVEPVPLALGDWRLVILDSGERHAHASSGYNERRAECAAACVQLGVESLRDASAGALSRLPQPLAMRAQHVLDENDRVRAAVGALHGGDLPALGALLNASHASQRDLFQVSTPAVEATVERLLHAGAAGARMVGGGFGGSVLGLLAPGVRVPPDAYGVRPGPGAHLLER